MSWAFCRFEVDQDFKHDLFFSSGGIMCIDEESPLYFVAEESKSFIAELQANVMARLWLLQSGSVEHTRVVFYLTTEQLPML